MDVMNIPEYTIDGYGNQSIIEINHFLIQTVRINEEPSIRKIIQIALLLVNIQVVEVKKKNG